MLKFVIIFLVFSLSKLGFAQTEQNNKPKINAVGVGKVSVFPNAAEITIGFEHIKPTLREAVNENQKTMEEVLQIVKNYVQDTLDIKISLISTDKAMRYNNKLEKDIFIGYESTQTLVFTLKDLSKMQFFTEELLKTKFHKISSISYFHTNAENYIKQAQELAVLDAVENTKRLAKVSQVNLGNIIYIETDKSPSDNAKNRLYNSGFETYGKGMGGRGVSSSGQLINYYVTVTIFSEILIK